MKFLLVLVLCFIVCVRGDKIVRIDPRAEDTMNPGDVVDSFTLNIIGGTYSYQPLNDNSQNAIIFFALDSRSGFGEAMWENEIYVKNLFLRSPDDTMYIFMSYANNAEEVVTNLQSIFIQTMNDLHISSEKQDLWLQRALFCTTPVEQLNNWIPELLQQWPTSLDQAIINVNDESIPAKRIDGRWPWMQPIDSILGQSSSYPVINFGDGCSESTIPLNGSIALVSNLQGSSCYWSEKFIHAELAGAVGVVVYSDEGEPLKDINCRELSCYLTTIPVTMITHEAGMFIIDSLNNDDTVSMRFTEDLVSGFYFAIDCNSELQEMGSLQYPSMSFLAWEAQYFDYYRDMLNTIAESTVPGSLDFVVNVYNNTIMDGPSNSSILTFDIPKVLEGYTLLLDMDLGCPGPKDSSCPAWDRILQVYICCGDVNSTIPNNGTENYFCMQEIGRWITPFARRVGRWVTDVTPLLPLINSGTDSESKCNFQITCGTTEHWVPTLNLRFHDYQPQSERPVAILPLFQGGTFDSSYNDKYSPIEFYVPEGTSKVLLYAVITGHGSDNNGCGEFCVTSHHFEFNDDDTNSKTFYNAGTPLGCARHASDGVEPNEYGTWLYGRDGWCDGQEVSPWIVDVTSELNVSVNNTVLYYGYYQGATPNPTENPGYIVMYSFLSFYSNQ